MDGLIATIIAGLVVTVIGAIVAFYFGGVREKQKREYESQIEEQRRQEERRKELDKRRAGTFTEIQTRAFTIMDALDTWLRRAETLGMIKPSEDALEVMPAEEAWRPFFEEAEGLGNQGFDIVNEMASLRDYYQAHESSLKPSTRSLFMSFDEEVCIRFASVLYEALETESKEEWMAEVREYRPAMDQLQAKRKRFLMQALPFYMDSVNKKLNANLQEGMSLVAAGFLETAQKLRSGWDFQAYRTAFHNEKAIYNG
jgi:hypothetical protein